MGSLQQYHRTLVNAGEGNIEDGGKCKRGRSKSCHATSLTYTWIYTLSVDLRGFLISDTSPLSAQLSSGASHQPSQAHGRPGQVVLAKRAAASSEYPCFYSIRHDEPLVLLSRKCSAFVIVITLSVVESLAGRRGR